MISIPNTNKFLTQENGVWILINLDIAGNTPYNSVQESLSTAEGDTFNGAYFPNPLGMLIIGGNEEGNYGFVRYLGYCHPTCKTCQGSGFEDSCLTCQPEHIFRPKEKNSEKGFCDPIKDLYACESTQTLNCAGTELIGCLNCNGLLPACQTCSDSCYVPKNSKITSCLSCSKLINGCTKCESTDDLLHCTECEQGKTLSKDKKNCLGSTFKSTWIIIALVYSLMVF